MLVRLSSPVSFLVICFRYSHSSSPQPDEQVLTNDWNGKYLVAKCKSQRNTRASTRKDVSKFLRTLQPGSIAPWPWSTTKGLSYPYSMVRRHGDRTLSSSLDVGTAKDTRRSGNRYLRILKINKSSTLRLHGDHPEIVSRSSFGTHSQSNAWTPLRAVHSRSRIKYQTPKLATDRFLMSGEFSAITRPPVMNTL